MVSSVSIERVERVEILKIFGTSFVPPKDTTTHPVQKTEDEHRNTSMTATAIPCMTIRVNGALYHRPFASSSQNSHSTIEI